MNPHAVTRDFEFELSRYTGARFVVATTSCTQAILMALAWHFKDFGPRRLVEIPKKTYVGVAYAIIEAGGWPTFRDEEWLVRGYYQCKPFQVFDSARYLTSDLYNIIGGGFVTVSFHWHKTLGIQQGGAILHDNPEADEWLRRARFDGRAEGVPPTQDTFPKQRAWHAYMSPETAAAGLVRLAGLPKHNAPLPEDGYADLSLCEAFK